ncbi:MAG: diguanylate cyclase [Planctomycetes bacterium]|nr:diguanylate cyclase [Planctomycetota bacterium]
MDVVSNSSVGSTGGGRVLLIGDISRALLDGVQVDRYPCEVRPNLLEGIDAAVRGHFAAVGVVMDGATHQLGPLLKALREGTKTRVFLLAQMHEEPIARRLVTAEGGESLADAYVVCPTCLTSLCALAGAEPGRLAAGQGGRASDGGAARDVQRPTSDAAPDATATVAPSVPDALLASLEQKIRYLERLATTDDLTGLKNRRYLWEFARQILDHARQTQGRVTLLVFDIDNFKHYNDVYGHLTGDEILREAAVLMRRCCRGHDVVGRIGGDEFAVVFWDSSLGRTSDPCRVTHDPGHAPRATGHGSRVPSDERRSATAEHPSEIILIARRFQKEFGNADLRLLGPRGEGVLTISGGLASFPRDGTTVQQLFERADLALREAKGSGKNRIYLVGQPQSDIAEIE